VRVVPRVERAEFVNVGVIVFSAQEKLLLARVVLPAARLRALDAAVDLPAVERQLAALERVARGGADAGPIGRLSASERFHWLVSPRSTMVQTSPVHVGLGADPVAAVAHLFAMLVE
jgi:hypothetical protein